MEDVDVVTEQALLDEVTRLIFDQLGNDIVEDVVFGDLISTDSGTELEVTVVLRPMAQPSVVADRYFGLTAPVREKLSALKGDIFPMIVPSFASKAVA